ncbi:MAG TPA: C40 family peptidase [Marmoricola sp.]
METLVIRRPGALGRIVAAFVVLAAMVAGTLVTGSGKADALAMSQVRADAVHLAAVEKGKPYVWGADGPGAFDCSGLVYYVFHRRLGVPLPRTADEQWHSTLHVRKSHVQRGDLVFFLSGDHAYHVGIYAGHHLIWNAPHTGARVRLEHIWTSRWQPGRVV